MVGDVASCSKSVGWRYDITVAASLELRRQSGLVMLGGLGLTESQHYSPPAVVGIGTHASKCDSGPL